MNVNRYTAIIPYGSNDQYRVVLWVNDTVFNVGYQCKDMDEALELRARLVDALETLARTKEKGPL